MNLFCYLLHPTAHRQFFYSCCFRCCQIRDIVGGSTTDGTYKKQKRGLKTQKPLLTFYSVDIVLAQPPSSSWPPTSKLLAEAPTCLHSERKRTEVELQLMLLYVTVCSGTSSRPQCKTLSKSKTQGKVSPPRILAKVPKDMYTAKQSTNKQYFFFSQQYFVASCYSCTSA